MEYIAKMKWTGLPILVLLALTGCVTDRSVAEVGGQRILVCELELKRDFRGRRVVGMVALQPAPVFADYTPEMGEMMAEAGKPRAEAACGGPAELLDVTRHRFQARVADLRFRCLDAAS